MARKGHWLASVAMTVLNEEAQVSAFAARLSTVTDPTSMGGGIVPYCSFKLSS